MLRRAQPSLRNLTGTIAHQPGAVQDHFAENLGQAKTRLWNRVEELRELHPDWFPVKARAEFFKRDPERMRQVESEG